MLSSFRNSWQPPAPMAISLLLLSLGLYEFGIAEELPLSDAGRLLQVGRPVERALAAGESHQYEVELGSGDFIEVIVEQRGADVEVALLDPEATPETPLAEIDNPNGRNGLERLLYLAAKAANLRLVVSSADEGAPPGSYTLKLEALRRPTPMDLRRVQAWDLVREGNRLRQGAAPAKLVEAIICYQQALDLFTGTPDAMQRPVLLNRIGQIHASLGDFEPAFAGFREALSIWEEAGDPFGQVMVLTSLGATFEQVGRPREALETYRGALPLVAGIQEPRPHAALLNNMGWVLFQLGESDRALEVLREALEFRKRSANLKGEAITLLNIGGVSESIGEYDAAIATNSRALGIAEALGDREIQMTAYNNLGTGHWKLGDADSALGFYSKALELVRMSHDRRLESTVLSNMGTIYAEQSRFDEAMAAQEKALQLIREVTDRGGEATVLHNIADIHQRQRRWEEAKKSLEVALGIWQELGMKSGEANTTRQLGEVARKMGDTAASRRLFENALALAGEIGDRGAQASTRASLANLDRESGMLERATLNAESALRSIEEVRARINPEKFKQSYFQTHRSLVELHLNILMDLHDRQPAAGHAKLAFQTSERVRARTLLESLGSGARIEKGADTELLRREIEVRRQINESEARRRGLVRKKAQKEKITAVEAELDELLRNLDRIRADLRARSPRYSSLTQPEPQTLEQIQSELGPDTLLLSYFLGEKRGFVWALTRSTLSAHHLPPRTEVEDAARELHSLLSQSDRRLARAPAERATQRLSAMLLGPVEKLLGKNRLVIVADGALHFTAFGSLPAPGKQGVPLVVDHEIVTLPSASVLPALRREAEQHPPRPGQIAILADPVFEPTDSRVSFPGAASTEQPEDSLAQRAAKDVGLDSFPRLHHSREEAEGIASFFAQEGVLKALDFDASKDVAINGDLARYRILHFATHGLLDTRRPDLSGLVLSLVDREGRPRDGFLRLHEIYNLDLPSELVVLSGCETALGKEVRGEGLIALTRGFMYAGTPAVVASLWRVDDRSTAQLMRRFYGAMLEQGLRPAAALRAAQISLFEQQPTAAPYFWAGFVFQGDWR
jgi:CHAT domain-containing protein/Tfp pilus assembly protein PilF